MNPFSRKDFGIPFNDPQADLILRTSDHVDFRVHKIILSLASPVFKDIFSLPTATIDGDEIRDGLPVVTLSESSRALELALRFMYPIPSPTVKLDDILILLEFSTKYDMKLYDVTIKVGLYEAKAKDPVNVYAISLIFGLTDIAELAAVESCRLPMRSLISPYLQRISVQQYHNFLLFRFDVNEALYSLAKDATWVSETPGSKRSKPGNCNKCWPDPKYSVWHLHSILSKFVDVALTALLKGDGIDTI